jgi:hypothetical protein
MSKDKFQIHWHGQTRKSVGGFFDKAAQRFDIENDAVASSLSEMGHPETHEPLEFPQLFTLLKSELINLEEKGLNIVAFIQLSLLIEKIRGMLDQYEATLNSKEQTQPDRRNQRRLKEVHNVRELLEFLSEHLSQAIVSLELEPGRRKHSYSVVRTSADTRR